MDYVNIKNSNIYISNHHFIIGDKLKLANSKNEPYYYIMNDIIDSNSFPINTSNINESNLFLIGKELDDFQTLNKLFLNLVGLSSIQEL